MVADILTPFLPLFIPVAVALIIGLVLKSLRR